MSDLKEDLDRALRAVPIGMAPVEQAKDQGRRIRTRRRVTVLAGTLAVVAVAAAYPAVTKTTAAPAAKVSPASSVSSTALSTWQGTRDPVLTENPGAKTTHGPNGPDDLVAAASGVIAAGTLGSNHWQAAITRGGANAETGCGNCFNFGATFGKGGPGALGSYSLAGGGSTGAGADAADAVTFAGSTSDGTNYAIFGQASTQVSYLEVMFTDGQSLELIPVLVDGIRYFAWVAPESMTVATIDAHLGGLNDAPGRTEEAVPFDLPGQVPVVTGFSKPGQAVLPRVTKVIGSGKADGTAWTATAYLGPWGTCVVAGAGDTTCGGPGPSDGTEVMGVPNPSVSTGVVWGAAAPGTALIKLDVSPFGAGAFSKPIAVGPELLWACWANTYGSGNPFTATGYDAAGNQVGSSPSSSVTATVAP